MEQLIQTEIIIYTETIKIITSIEYIIRAVHNRKREKK